MEEWVTFSHTTAISEDHFFVHLSSEDSTVSPLIKEPHDFEVVLPSPQWLYSSWEMSLRSITYKGKFAGEEPEMLTATCDWAESSVINSSKFQVLRRFPHIEGELNQSIHWDFDAAQYIRVLPGVVSSVRLRLLNEKGEPATFAAGSWVCYTLHLRRRALFVN